MIQVKVFRKDNRIQRVSVSGHSDYGEYGSDIVCAGVSALTIGFANGLLDVCGIEDLEVEASEGDVTIGVPESIKEEDREIVELFLRSLVNGYEDIRQSYPDELEITQIKETNDD